MVRNTKQIGDEGERIACEYLRERGYEILEKNWRFQHLEVDIVAEDPTRIAIVEVKFRETGNYERPQDAVTKKKQRYLIRAAEAYINQFNPFKPIHFDIISIIGTSPPQINHIIEAFYP
ncbi:MAG: YraN family protein [Bacteroidota bacterium]|nr:YraN family protein [Bacteroidota bacterium]